MRSLISTVVIVAMTFNQAMCKGDFEQLAAQNNVPDKVMSSFKQLTNGMDLDATIVKIDCPDKKKGCFRFYLDAEKNDLDLAQVAINSRGVVKMKMYRYENSGNLPLEVIVKMQEHCKLNDVHRMAKIELKSKTQFQAVCGETVYNFKENLDLIGTKVFVESKDLALSIR